MRVKTANQTANNKHQVAHIYIDITPTNVRQVDGTLKTVTAYNYTGHNLFALEKND